MEVTSRASRMLNARQVDEYVEQGEIDSIAVGLLPTQTLACYDLQWLTLHQRRLLLCHCQTFKIIFRMDCVHYIKFTDCFKK